MSVAQQALDGRSPASQAGRRPARTQRFGVAAPRIQSAGGFPERPAEIPERVWRLTEHWLLCGEQSGIRRAASPWYFAKELKATIKASGPVQQLIRRHGGDVVEDFIRRMVEMFWRDYVDSGNTRSQAVNLFLDDYWDDLVDRIKTQLSVEKIKSKIEDGTVKVTPKAEPGSLLNDAGYQAARTNLKAQAYLEQHPIEDWDSAPVVRPVTLEDSRKLLSELSQRLHRRPAKRDPEPASQADRESDQEADETDEPDPPGGRSRRLQR
jgi:hypothetical protein